MITPGENLPIDAKTRAALGQEISLYIDDLETNYSGYFSDIATWWRWYEAEPMIKGEKNFPFKGASNIIVPLIQIMSDAHVNRAYGAIFRSSTDIWSVRTEREDLIRRTQDISRFLNWTAANNDYNLRLTAYDNLLESAVIGSSVLALNWREDVRWAYSFSRGSKKLNAQPVRFARGAFPEHVPREQILWDTNFQIQEAPFICREFRWSWSQLRAKADLDPTWDTEVIESIRGKGELRGPSQIVQREKDALDSRQESTFGVTDIHDIREVHVDWPLLGAMGFKDDRLAKPGKEALSVPSPPLVVTIDRNTKQILRLIAEPYFFPYKPFFDIFYKKRSGRGHSVGIAKRGEHMQRGMTASLNQAIDARTRANAVWAKTKRKDYLNKPLDPSHPIYDPDMNSFEPFNLPTATFDDQRMMTVIQTIAERQTGQSDPALGRETRQGGHPSPARTTAALLQQSDLMQETGKEQIRLQYGRLGEAIASLYQQFEANTDGKLQRVLGPVDAQRVEEFLFPEEPVSGTLEFDVLTLSGDNNPEERMNRAVLVSQMNQNYWLSVIKALSFLENPQVGPIVKKGVIEAIRAGTKAHVQFLDAGDVDDLERYVLSLGDQEQTNTADLQRATQRATEIAQSSMGAQAGGMGGGGAAPQGGAPGALGAGGRI